MDIGIVKDNVDEYLKAVDAAKQRGLEKVGLTAERYAKGGHRKASQFDFARGSRGFCVYRDECRVCRLCGKGYQKDAGISVLKTCGAGSR